jgi:site-specific DNA recombinase
MANYRWPKVPVASPETLTAFLERLRVSAGTIDVLECQRLVRLLVKVILVNEQTIRHSIPVPPAPPRPSGGSRKVESHRLRSGGSVALGGNIVQFRCPRDA